MKTMPVSLLLCLNNFLLFNHILPGERTKIDVSSPFWTNGGLGELAMGKKSVSSHLIMASLYGGRQGKKYKLLFMDKIQRTSWGMDPFWSKWNSTIQEMPNGCNCSFLPWRNTKFCQFPSIQQVRSFQKACKHRDKLHDLPGLQEWHQPSPDLWHPSGEELLWGQLSFCFSEVVV